MLLFWHEEGLVYVVDSESQRGNSGELESDYESDYNSQWDV